jgi:squalene-hopene/tetraprenyl-beta-curcumene cyclase
MKLDWRWLLVVASCFVVAGHLCAEEKAEPTRKPALPLTPGVERALAVEEELTLENVVPPTPNRPDEPFRREFSLPAAVRFLDAAALSWQKERNCFACHSNYVYLAVRPAISHPARAHDQIRAALEQVAEHPREQLKRIGVAEAVMVAAVLAWNDALTTGRLHPTARKALDRMWTLQREDGGFTWLKNAQPPSEIDDHYGVTMAAIGAGVAPDDYARTPQARAGLDKIRRYLRNHPPAHLHHRAMRLLASEYVDGIMTLPERRDVVDDLLALQKPDGGWGLATLGTWERSDGKQQDYASSDGYGTGFAIYVLRRAGVPANDPRIQRGIAWLKTYQRASGRWFTRSLWKDQRHYLTHAGTAYALLALAQCGEIRPTRGSGDNPR